MCKEFTLTLVKGATLQIEPRTVSPLANPKILNLSASDATSSGGAITVSNGPSITPPLPIPSPGVVDMAFAVDVSEPTMLNYDGVGLPPGSSVTVKYSYD
jgi:hypothetical protein